MAPNYTGTRDGPSQGDIERRGKSIFNVKIADYLTAPTIEPDPERDLGFFDELIEKWKNEDGDGA